jgi:hypothetical protein
VDGKEPRDQGVGCGGYARRVDRTRGTEPVESVGRCNPRLLVCRRAEVSSGRTVGRLKARTALTAPSLMAAGRCTQSLVFGFTVRLGRCDAENVRNGPSYHFEPHRGRQEGRRAVQTRDRREAPVQLANTRWPCLSISQRPSTVVGLPARTHDRPRQVPDATAASTPRTCGEKASLKATAASVVQDPAGLLHGLQQLQGGRRSIGGRRRPPALSSPSQRS